MWYIYPVEYYPTIKNNEIMPFTAAWMDKYYYITYRLNLKYDTNELIYKTEIDAQTEKTDLWLLKGKE